jgi:hypothetical protein
MLRIIANCSGDTFSTTMPPSLAEKDFGMACYMRHVGVPQ